MIQLHELGFRKTGKNSYEYEPCNKYIVELSDIKNIDTGKFRKDVWTFKYANTPEVGCNFIYPLYRIDNYDLLTFYLCGYNFKQRFTQWNKPETIEVYENEVVDKQQNEENELAEFERKLSEMSMRKRRK